MKIRLSRISVPEIPASGRQRSGEVAQLTTDDGGDVHLPAPGAESSPLVVMENLQPTLTSVVTDKSEVKIFV